MPPNKDQNLCRGYRRTRAATFLSQHLTRSVSKKRNITEFAELPLFSSPKKKKLNEQDKEKGRPAKKIDSMTQTDNLLVNFGVTKNNGTLTTIKFDELKEQDASFRQMDGERLDLTNEMQTAGFKHTQDILPPFLNVNDEDLPGIETMNIKNEVLNKVDRIEDIVSFLENSEKPPVIFDEIVPLSSNVQVSEDQMLDDILALMQEQENRYTNNLGE